MPGSVYLTSATAVLPESLSRIFTRSQDLAVHENDYPDGASQRERLVEAPRRRWSLSKYLTPAQLQELRNFYSARKGPTEPFYFYDPYATNPRYAHDPTGASLYGRYIVRFEGQWRESTEQCRTNVQLELTEIT